ncbi:hypothetical protein BH11PSE1_BH11PSE1_24050 [soil metagenome]
MSGSLDRYFRRTTADIEEARRRLEDQGRALWNEATRSGQAAVGDTLTSLRKLASPTPQPVQRHAVVAPPNRVVTRAPAPSRQPAQPPAARSNAASRPANAGSFAERAAAGLHGVSDGATFGVGDRASALVHAGLPGDGHWQDRYGDQMAALKAQDAYDQAHYPITRTAGQVAGAVVTAFTPVGMEAGALKAASYIPKAARFVKGATATKRITPLARGIGDYRRWSAITAGGGGAMGVAGQGLSDIGAKRQSSLGSYAAAAIGGATDGLGTVYLGPARGGALGGAVASAADDAFNGRMPSLVRMSEGAAAGSVIGKGLGALGTFGAHALPTLSNGPKWMRKGTVGESLSKARSWLEGEGVDPGTHTVAVGNRRTVLDHKTLTGSPVEAKFGYAARLSTPQRMLRADNSKYRVDHFLPKDIGKLLSLPFTSFDSGLEQGR